MSDVSIALACNVYNDAAAVRGLLEASAPFFDNLFFVHSGPGGAYSTDGTIETIQDFGATIVFDDMQRGFGHIRSRLIHDCGCSWAFILDADERFHPQMPVMHCEGTDRYPNQLVPNLSAFKRDEVCNQGALLKQLINEPRNMSIITIRRHWFDFAMSKPAENWLLIKDYQMRIVRNVAEIEYQPDRVMHEQLIDVRTGVAPAHPPDPDPYLGPFHDHFHLHFRRTRPGQKEANEKNYQRLEKGEAMLVAAEQQTPNAERRTPNAR